MRILHTSDWHLGKYLETYSRLDEQKEFIDELVGIADEKQIDLIIVAGDVYDTANPPAGAEQLFYRGMKQLAAGGKRPVLVIGGNHDSPERLTAAAPLVTELGVILLGTPKSVAAVGDYGPFAVVDAGEGFLELRIRNEHAIIITMPYPSEKRLNELFTVEQSVSDEPHTETEDRSPDNTSLPGESEFQQSYSARIGELFAKLSGKYRDDTINLAAGHFYIAGGETSHSERDIQLGGAYAVDGTVLPRAQYIAMGHLHRPQKVRTPCPHTYYAGSPIQYSKSEASTAKCVYIAELKPNREAGVEKIYLRNPKPIEIWKANSIQEAIREAENRRDENSWVFLEIQTDRPLRQDEIKLLKTTKRDIIEIIPFIQGESLETESPVEQERTAAEEFTAFYAQRRKTPPSDELMEIFMRITEE